jgi:molybdopterin-biosynthesis enzyme MoeA-like protein
MMGEFPVGSEIIPNPFNRIPGFAIARHYFVPGFPQMAWPMLEWVLDTHYRELFAPGRIAERSIIVRGAGESQFIDVMNRCLACYPGVKVFSLPRMAPERHVELGVRGDAHQVPDAFSLLKNGVGELGVEWTEVPAAAPAAG